MKLLIVEDNSNLIKLYQMQFKKLGEDNIEFATSVNDAQSHLSKNKYDGVIIDYVLPDGFGVCLSTNCIDKRTPFVYVTGNDDLMADSMMFSTSWVVKKPVSMSSLSRILHYFEEQR